MGPADHEMEVGKGRRLMLTPEALIVEVRGASGWVPARAVPYPEIRLVYSYETRDWSYLGIVAGYWFVALILIGIASTFLNWSGGTFALVILLATVLLGGLALYRILTVPKRLLRVDAYSGTLLFPNRGPGFFPQLAARIPAESATPPTQSQVLASDPAAALTGTVTVQPEPSVSVDPALEMPPAPSPPEPSSMDSNSSENSGSS